MTEDETAKALVRAAYAWATEHMDQWERIKFETPHGTVYLTLTLHSDWPKTFTAVDLDGRRVVTPTPQGDTAGQGRAG